MSVLDFKYYCWLSITLKNKSIDLFRNSKIAHILINIHPISLAFVHNLRMKYIDSFDLFLIFKM